VRTTKFVLAVVTVALVAAACSDADDGSGGARSVPQPTPSTPDPTPPSDDGVAATLNLRALEIELRPVLEGLEAPLFVTHAGDGSGRLFLVEQVGRVRVVDDGRLVEGPFLDLTSSVTYGGEQGLLGLAFHPRYRDNGKFYVNYTDTNGDTIVAEYTVSNDPNRADPDSARRLLFIEQPYGNHNGGALAFGPDGYLYIATGDGGSGGDPHGNGQSLATLLGKLLRIDVDDRARGRAYGIPADNPFVDRDGAAPEIWAFGLRNPWRFSFDDGTLWIGDVGQSDQEEINRVRADQAGINYGWNVMEGTECYEAEQCDRSGMTLPSVTYNHDSGCSVTGGHVYRGSDWPKMQGAYLFGDYCSGYIWGLRANGSGDPVLLLESGASISSFGLDEDGEMYMTDLSSGVVYRVVGR
jgi:glucose/arabinose dehydrogenase